MGSVIGDMDQLGDGGEVRGVGAGTRRDRQLEAGSWTQSWERERAGGVEQGGMLISDPMVFFMHACASHSAGLGRAEDIDHLSSLLGLPRVYTLPFLPSDTVGSLSQSEVYG